MTGKRPIQPKPTTYRNITFRSVLEARTAVFLDNIPNVLRWVYEPHTYRLSPQNWEYTPDFELNLMLDGEKHTILMEVKPSDMSDEYVHLLSRMSNVFRHPLLVFIPDYFHNRTASTTIYRGHQVAKGVSYYLSGIGYAFRIASDYRFDLRS